jgi:hypothetical protein
MSSGQPLVCNWSRHIQRTSTCRATCVWRRREPGRSPRMDSGQPCDWPFLVIISQIWAVACFNVPLQSGGDPGESWKKSNYWMIWGGPALQMSVLSFKELKCLCKSPSRSLVGFSTITEACVFVGIPRGQTRLTGSKDQRQMSTRGAPAWRPWVCRSESL